MEQYRFALTGCEGTPPSKYRITATPIDADAGMKTFCSDESGTIKFVTDGKTFIVPQSWQADNLTSGDRLIRLYH